MARVNLLDRKTKLGVKALRVLAGGKGHAPSQKNICIGKALKGKTYAHGGMRSPEVHRAFVEAAKSCGFNIAKSTSDVR